MKWRVLLTVGIGTFMSAVNGSVVNAVLPLMRRGLQVDFATIEWVVTIYLLVVSGLLLLFGRLGDLRGHRTWFVSGLAGFAGASGLCCLAPDATFLILFRVLQAIAAAMLFANSPAILTKSCAPEAADGGSVSQVSARVRRGRPRRQVAWPSQDRLRFLSDFVETGSRCFLSLFFIRISVFILDFSF